MLRVVAAVTILGLAVIAYVSHDPAHAASEPGCAGSWLARITLDERDVSEDALIAFASDGAIVVHGPPVLPALPGPGEDPLQASSGLGTWQSTGADACAFEFVRLLGGDDGVGVGTLNVRGTAAVDDSGEALDGSLTSIRSTGFGQMAATASDTFTGTSFDGPLLWLTPAAADAAMPGSDT